MLCIVYLIFDGYSEAMRLLELAELGFNFQELYLFCNDFALLEALCIDDITIIWITIYISCFY